MAQQVNAKENVKDFMREELKMNVLLEEAEDKFRQGVQTISHYGDQAKDYVRRQPGIALAATAVFGFAVGLLLRRSMRSGSSSKENG